MGQVACVSIGKGDGEGKADGDSAEFHSYWMEIRFFLIGVGEGPGVYRCPALVKYLVCKSCKEWTFRLETRRDDNERLEQEI